MDAHEVRTLPSARDYRNEAKHLRGLAHHFIAEGRRDEAMACRSTARIYESRARRLQARQGFCSDARHDEPCPLPCQACSEECGASA